MTRQPNPLSPPHIADADHVDSGFTLVELLVSMLLFGLVLAVAGMLLLNGLNGQRDVVGTGQASNDAQVAVTSMERAIRNSSTGGVWTSGSALVTHTGGGDSTSTWQCQAWTYVPPVAGAPTGRIFSKKGPVGTTLNVPGSGAFASGVPAGWMLVVDGVTPPTAAAPIFAASPTSGSWTVAFQSERINQKKKGAGVVIKTTVAPRPQAVGTTSGGCF